MYAIAFRYGRVKTIIKYSRVMIKFISRALIVCSLSLFMFSCTGNKQKQASESEKEQLIIFHAGSLSVPFKQITEEFNKEYPNVEVLLEAAGSRKCARMITDLNKECDIMASADYTVIDKLLIPDYADWNIKFVSNEMTIVYHDGSKYSDVINNNNWHEILLKSDVAFGRSDPNSDPCGYRAVLTSKLAETYYNIDGLAEKLLAKDVNYIRPKETDLLGLLEANAIDYIFLYRSVAEQHGLKFVILPDSINLKVPAYEDFYKQATVEISGKEPGETITKYGESMVYSVTIVKNAPNKNAAMNFVKFLLNNEKGMEIMAKNGQPSVIPSSTDSYNSIPEELKEFATK